MLKSKNVLDQDTKTAVHKKMTEVAKKSAAEYRAKALETYDFEISHSPTSSDCSFEMRKIESHEMMKTDNKYNIKIEKIYPKKWRRRRFQKVSSDIEEHREEYMKKIRKNPENYASKKGIRNVLAAMYKDKTSRKDAGVTRKKKILVSHHPWIPFINEKDRYLPKDSRDVLIREQYYKYVNSGTFEDDISFNPEILGFIRWYEMKRDGKIDESDLSDPEKNKSRGRSKNNLLEPVYDSDLFKKAEPDDDNTKHKKEKRKVYSSSSS